ncbi:MAG: glycosyltransferase family 4 protein [Eggerthellaceae bacterium]|nr:glycosyltransferase family 4 protein [Eggerthellaceae bacterium]
MHKTYCIFTTLFAPHVGGQEQFTEHIGCALARRGNTVIIVTCRIDDESPDIETIYPTDADGVSSEDVVGEVIVVRVESTRALGGRYPVPKKQALDRVLESLKESAIDQVVINARFYELSIAGARFAEKIGQRPIIIDHGSAHLTLGNAALDTGVRAIEHAQTKRILSVPADYYGVSEKSCAWLEHFGIASKGIIPNAIDADAFVAAANDAHFREELGIPSDHVLVSFCGRLCPEKGVTELLEAAWRLVGREDIHFLLAGDGPLREAVEASGLDRVHALGALTPSDVAALLLESDIFCLPTRSEGFSTALLEAVACKVAPVITDVGGAHELIPSDDFGIILPDADPDAIASSIIRLADDPTFRLSCAENIARRVRENHSWDETARLLEQASELASQA